MKEDENEKYEDIDLNKELQDLFRHIDLMILPTLTETIQ